ncbi:MAG: hypothetical protein WCS37_01410 [Chloroflexota bacterium]|nr:hypothetical protein [Chloroflexota bacterium]
MPELHLKVFSNRSELVKSDGTTEIFTEGPNNPQTKARYKKISDALKNGYLENQILLCKENPERLNITQIKEEHIQLLEILVSSLTSEVGRAIIGLTILQLCVKVIEPEQSIRLHKGGSSAKDFSWSEGISMRTLDNTFITPVLRKYDLLKLNKDGFMMTRSLAENYPYSTVYKAHIRGARVQWTEIVEAVENKIMDPVPALQYLLSQLLNQANAFLSLRERTINHLKSLISLNKLNEKQDIYRIIKDHAFNSNYAARIMEIAMHTLMQGLQDTNALGSLRIVPLSQMRSANKKHGNIGDIELTEDSRIVESWDAKFGKSYLRDELEELNDKLEGHPNIKVVGFITNVVPERLEEIQARVLEIEAYYDLSVQILTLDKWIDNQFNRAAQEGIAETTLAVAWITAYTESLAQLRPTIAPIDEPCYQWLETLDQIFLKFFQNV